MARERVIGYFDDHNIHGGLRDSRLSRLFYFNPIRVAAAFLRAGQRLVHLHYFTSKFRRSQLRKRLRQGKWISALSTLPKGEITVHYGEITKNRLKCHRCEATLCSQCGTRMHRFIEKRTDGNLITQLVLDAVDDKFDTAVLVSGDTDLCNVISRLLERFPDKKIIVAFPPSRYSRELIKVASDFFHIDETMLRLNQFPDTMVANGKTIVRPEPWY